MSVLGIAIGAIRINAGRVSGEGRVLSSKAVKTPASLGALETALHYIVAAGDPPDGIGVACAVPESLRYLESHSVSDLLGAALRRDVPIRADSDARAAMAAEAVWGAARGRANAVLLTLGATIGGAVIADGRILRGNAGGAGNLGHIAIDSEGVLCSCGSRGCLETVCSVRAIEAEAFAAIRRGCASLLSEWFGAKPQDVTCRAVFEAAAGSDPLARAIVARAVRVLGAAVAGLLHAFDPEIIILGGPLAAAGASLFDPLRAEVVTRVRREIPIVPRQVEDESGIADAAALVTQLSSCGEARS